MVQALALMASLFVEYGFGISAARQVALAREDKNKVTEIFGHVLSAKLIVSSVFVLIFFLWLTVYGYALFEAQLLIFGVLCFLAFGLSPVWLFYGVEELAMITLVDVFLRCSGLALLLGLVKGQEDYHLVLGILASVSVLNTLAGCCLCAKWVSRIKLSISGGLSQIKHGFHIFIYKGAGNVLMSAGTPLVSLFSGAQVLAYYAPAEKLVRSLAGLAAPVLVGIFPLLSRLGVSNRRSAVWSCLVISAVFFIGGVLLAIAVILVGREAMVLLLGREFAGVAELLNLFVWLIPFRLANQSMGLAGLIVLGRQKLLAKLTLVASVCAVACSAGLAGIYGATGVVAGFITAEVVLFILLVSIIARLWFTQSTVTN